MRGFLPSDNPFGRLAVRKEEYRQLVDTVEHLFADLPVYLKFGNAREEIVCQLREVAMLVDHAWTESFGADLMEERAFLIYACFAAVFVNTDKPLNRLAKEITIPLVRLGARVRRKPVLDYYSYIICNWRLTGSNLTVDGIEPLFTFSDTAEERQYIKSRVMVERHADLLLLHKPSLETLQQQLEKMIQLLKNSPQLPLRIACCLQPFTKVMYEGWGWTEPQSFTASLVTQSPTLSLISRLLRVEYNDSDLSNHRTSVHNDMIAAVTPLDADDPKAYNECLEAFAELVDLFDYSAWDRFDLTKSDFMQRYRR